MPWTASKHPQSICWDRGCLHTSLHLHYITLASHLCLCLLTEAAVSGRHHAICGGTTATVFHHCPALWYGCSASCRTFAILPLSSPSSLILLPPGHSPQSNPGDTLCPTKLTSQDSPTESYCPLPSRQNSPKYLTYFQFE